MKQLHERRCETCGNSYIKGDKIYSPRRVCKLTNWNVDMYDIGTELIGVVGCCSWVKQK